MKNSRTKAVIALKKAKSNLDRVIQMIENDKYCIDIIQQNLASIGLIKSSNLNLLEGHLNHCFVNAVKEGNKRKLDEMVGEILTVMKIAQNK